MDAEENALDLPSWIECRSLHEAGTATALQRFIYRNEPQGQIDSTMFRRQLAEMLSEIKRDPHKYVDPYEEDGTIINPCRCGWGNVTLAPHGYCSHQVMCNDCGTRGIPASTPSEAIRLWNSPLFEAQIAWFPRGCHLTMTQVLAGQWLISYKYETTTYSPGVASYYSLAEALERCYREFEDRYMSDKPNILVPWRTRQNGSLPGGLCCLNAAGRYCREHDPGSYQQQDDGKWVLT